MDLKNRIKQLSRELEENQKMIFKSMMRKLTVMSSSNNNVVSSRSKSADGLSCGSPRNYGDLDS